MTYKTLRRKSDGQWMRLFNGQIIKSDTPDMWEEKYCKALLELPFNWSLYELVEVAVIPVDELPTEEEIYTASKDEDILHPLNTPKPAFRIGANWYESRIKSR